VEDRRTAEKRPGKRKKHNKLKGEKTIKVEGWCKNSLREGNFKKNVSNLEKVEWKQLITKKRPDLSVIETNGRWMGGIVS
jgi:hypothetical protein